MHRLSNLRPLSLSLLVAASLGACGIRSDVPDFEYPESATEQRRGWPDLVLTETLIDVSTETNTERDEAQEEADALAKRGEALRRRGKKL